MSTKVNIELQQFYDELVKHDWFHHYSDSNSVFVAGDKNYKRLKRLANNLGSEAVELLTQYALSVFTGPNYGTEKKPKPERPGGPKPKVVSNIDNGTKTTF